MAYGFHLAYLLGFFGVMLLFCFVFMAFWVVFFPIRFDWCLVLVIAGLCFCYFVAQGAPFFLPVVVATAFLEALASGFFNASPLCNCSYDDVIL